MIFKRTKKYYLPDMDYWVNCDNMLKGSHLLIAGATGSGKSVLLNSIIYTLLAKCSPVSDKGCQFILIDPKRVELNSYKKLPHTLKYCTENKDIIKALDYTIDIMEYRYKYMQRKHIKLYDDFAIYVIIDELGDLMTTCKKEVMPRLQRIAQLGRAAKIHLIACTQCPNRRVIPAELTLNFTDKVALKCDTAIESKQIINIAGAETLPPHGTAYHRSSNGLKLVGIPLTPDIELLKRIDFWIKYK